MIRPGRLCVNFEDVLFIILLRFLTMFQIIRGELVLISNFTPIFSHLSPYRCLRLNRGKFRLLLPQHVPTRIVILRAYRISVNSFSVRSEITSPVKYHDTNITRLRCASGMRGQTYLLFLIISLPQHISGTLQASSDPELQVQAFFTANSRSHLLQ